MFLTAATVKFFTDDMGLFDQTKVRYRALSTAQRTIKLGAAPVEMTCSLALYGRIGNA
jgi:hypothetical protein